MKRIMTLAIAGLMMLALGAAPVLAAGPGSGQGAGPGAGWGAGSGAGTGVPVRDCTFVLAGEPFSYSGTVSAVGYLTGGGLTLAIDSGSVTLYGLGPWWYWEQQGVNWPQVGDTLSATGYTVDLNGVATNIMMTVTTMDGKTIQLRDPDNGCPLWAGGPNQ
jgi:hypothetical protein